MIHTTILDTWMVPPISVGSMLTYHNSMELQNEELNYVRSWIVTTKYTQAYNHVPMEW
jgi:hypothetical protein